MRGVIGFHSNRSDLTLNSHHVHLRAVSPFRRLVFRPLPPGILLWRFWQNGLRRATRTCGIRFGESGWLWLPIIPEMADRAVQQQTEKHWVHLNSSLVFDIASVLRERFARKNFLRVSAKVSGARSRAGSMRWPYQQSRRFRTRTTSLRCTP